MQHGHRLALLKHELTLYFLAIEGVLYIALNLTGNACYTLIPDCADNMTNVIKGHSICKIFQSPCCIMCDVLFCTLLLTFAKTMILLKVGVVMTGNRIQLLLLVASAIDDFVRKDEVATNVVDTYPLQ